MCVFFFYCSSMNKQVLDRLAGNILTALNHNLNFEVHKFHCTSNLYNQSNCQTTNSDIGVPCLWFKPSTLAIFSAAIKALYHNLYQEQVMFYLQTLSECSSCMTCCIQTYSGMYKTCRSIIIFLHIRYMYYLCIHYWSSLQCIHTLELWILRTLTDCVHTLLSMVFRYLTTFFDSGLQCVLILLYIMCRYLIL